MSEERETYQVATDEHANLVDIGCNIDTVQFVNVSRRELEQEHTHLLGRVQQLRRLLGLPPLPTGKQVRREQAERR